MSDAENASDELKGGCAKDTPLSKGGNILANNDQEESEDFTTLLINVIEQAEIPFLNELLLAVMGNDGEVYCPIVPFCRHLGIVDTKAQTRRIKEDETMKEALRLMPIETSGGAQQMQCLRVDMLVLWLTHIREGQCKPEIRPTLRQYKREAARAILAYFTTKAQTRTMIATSTRQEQLPIPLPGADLAEWRAWHLAMAELYTTLQSQQATLTTHEKRLDRHDEEIAALADNFLGMREALATIGEMPEPRISIHQQNQIQALVSKIHDATRIHQGTIFAAFKKHWRLPRYDELPAAQFDAAYEWLRQWGRAQLAQKPALGQLPLMSAASDDSTK